MRRYSLVDASRTHPKPPSEDSTRFDCLTSLLLSHMAALNYPPLICYGVFYRCLPIRRIVGIEVRCRDVGVQFCPRQSSKYVCVEASTCFLFDGLDRNPPGTATSGDGKRSVIALEPCRAPLAGVDLDGIDSGTATTLGMTRGTETGFILSPPFCVFDAFASVVSSAGRYRQQMRRMKSLMVILGMFELDWPVEDKRPCTDAPDETEYRTPGELLFQALHFSVASCRRLSGSCEVAHSVFCASNLGMVAMLPIPVQDLDQVNRAPLQLWEFIPVLVKL